MVRAGVARPRRAAPQSRALVYIFILFVAGFALVLPAGARELQIQSFHSELVVLPDSSLDVTETIEVRFIGEWNGIFRTIPVEYPGPGGFNYSLFLTDVNASQAGNPSLKIDRIREGPNLKLKIYVPG